MGKKSSKLSVKVLKALQENTKPLKPEDLSNILDLNQRSVRYALNILYDKELVEKIPDMNDLRTNFYVIKKTILNSEFNEVLAQI